MSDELEIRIVEVSEVPQKWSDPTRFTALREALKKGKAAQIVCRENEQTRQLQANIHASLGRDMRGRYRTQTDNANNCVWVIPKDAEAKAKR